MKIISRAVLCLLFVSSFATGTASAEPVWVQVRESMVRSKPAFYSSSVASVRYGDQLEKISEEGGWVKVQGKKGQGFVPVTTLSEDKIVLSAKDITKIKADSADVVLAGKGFSKEVEQEYKKKGTGARFDLVDQVERTTRVSNQEVRDFVKKGELKG